MSIHQISDADGWRPIKEAPVGPVVILGNENTGDTWPGYGYFGRAPFPMWCAIHPEFTGRCKPTHFQEFPQIGVRASQEAA